MLLQYVVHKNMYYHTECQYVFALSLVHEFTPGQTVLVSLPLRLYNAIDHIQCEALKGRIHLNDITVKLRLLRELKQSHQG